MSFTATQVVILSGETTSVMAHKGNSGDGGVLSNSQSTYTTPNSLAAGDIQCFDRRFPFHKTLTSMGTQLHKHSKCQTEQVNKITEAVTQLTSLHNVNKLAARSTDDPKNSDDLDSWENNEENDRWKGSLSMKLITAFTMKPTWYFPFCLIRRPHHLQC